MKNTVLLVTFLKNRKTAGSVLKILSEQFDVVNRKVFLLKDVNDENSYMLSYNIHSNSKSFSDYLFNTITLHRKKETNTLYTLNALNEIIFLQNNNVFDDNFSVNWEEYRNCIVITDKENYLKVIHTELIKTFNLF